MIVDYKSDLRSLARSIVIKSSHQAEVINNHIVSTFGSRYLIEDKYTWRYYLNLNGEYHFSNTQDIKVYVVELDRQEILTKELLDNNPKTRAELNKFSRSYLNLVDSYPADESLIKGIINPIEIERALNASNGEILAYSNSVSEDSDTLVLKVLSKYTEAIYYRWFNPYYIKSDKFYLASFLMFLYSTLESKIDLIRLDNIHTHNAHSYHVELFFRSTLGLDITYLNKKSILWLYQNLRAVISNNGKRETLQQLIDNVLTPNAVGIGNITINKSKPNLISTSDYNQPLYDVSDIDQLIALPMNNFYSRDSMSVPEITGLQIDNNYIHPTQYMEVNEIVEKVERNISNNTNLDLDTKVLHLLRKEDRDILPFPRINMVLDNIFYLHKKTNVDYLFKFTDNNTNQTYDLDYNKASRLLAYLLVKSVGRDTDTVILEPRAIIKVNPDDVTDLLVEDDTDFYYDTILDDIKPVMAEAYTDYKEIVKYIQDGIEYFSSDWVLKSTILNYVSIGNMELLDYVKHTDRIEIPIDDVVFDVGLIENSNYDYFMSVVDLLAAITNGELLIDINNLTVDIIKSYVDMMMKLTSYNVQVLGNNKAADTTYLFDVGLGILEGKQCTRVTAYFNGLEDIGGDLSIIKPPDVVMGRAPDAKCLVEADLTPMVGMFLNYNAILTEQFKYLNMHHMSNADGKDNTSLEILKESDLNIMNGLLSYKASPIRDEYKMGALAEYYPVDGVTNISDEITKESDLNFMGGMLMHKASPIRDEYRVGALAEYYPVDSKLSTDPTTMLEFKLTLKDGTMNHKETSIDRPYRVSTNTILNMTMNEIIETDTATESVLTPMTGNVVFGKKDLELE